VAAGHLGTFFPSPETYGRQASVTTPVLSRYFQVTPRYPPAQAKLTALHSIKSYGEKTRSTAPFEAIVILSEKASVPAKAQHEPQDY